MNSSDSLANIAAALAIAQADAQAALKGGFNKFDKYSYAKYEDIAAAAKPVLTANGLAVVFTAEDLIALDDRAVGADKSKFEHAVRIKVSARLLHKSGEWMESSAWGEGQDRADKAPYKAMTGAKKYLLAGLLAIATTDDPESDESVGGAGDTSQHQQHQQHQQRADRAPGSKASTQTAPVQSAPAPAPMPAEATEEDVKKAAATLGSWDRTFALKLWEVTKTKTISERIALFDNAAKGISHFRDRLGAERTDEWLVDTMRDHNWPSATADQVLAIAGVFAGTTKPAPQLASVGA